MENKKTLIVVIVSLVVGMLVGHCIAVNRMSCGHLMMGRHQMPDGSMMNNGGSMQDMMTDMSAALRYKTGDAFDRAFLSEMIVHHEGAVEMAQAALKSANHQEIKDMANGIISAQTREITQMKQWLRDWYNQ